MNHQIIKTVETKGVDVTIKVDFDEGTCSIVEKGMKEWKAKEFLFAGRTLDYMNGWLNILEAMSNAVKEGKKLLEADLAEKSRIKEELIVRVERELNKKKK